MDGPHCTGKQLAGSQGRLHLIAACFHEALRELRFGGGKLTRNLLGFMVEDRVERPEAVSPWHNQ